MAQAILVPNENVAGLVARRMPRHMNVPLAEANGPYDGVFEFEHIKSELALADVAYVIGANDVTNPSTRDGKSSPIYAMPILDVDRARLPPPQALAWLRLCRHRQHRPPRSAR